jgi:hypothetical protein
MSARSEGKPRAKINSLGSVRFFAGNLPHRTTELSANFADDVGIRGEYPLAQRTNLNSLVDDKARLA